MCSLKICIMTCALGMVAGVAVGACNSDMVCCALKKGKKELKRLKKKYNII